MWKLLDPTASESLLDPHERVVFAHHRDSGLRAIIALHDTTLGPALGGTRFYPYDSEAQALADVMRLSRGMTYKAAMAGLDLGGGKAVIVGDPHVDKTPRLLRAYGNLVESLNGGYITSADVGTTAQDMDMIAETTRHVVACSPGAGGSGSTARLTALGVLQAMTAAATHVWGSGDLAGRTIGVEGVGKVGTCLAELLDKSGANVVVSDADPRAVSRVLSASRNATARESLVGGPLDIYAPCALGGTLDPPSVDRLSAAIVCGAANNQLSATEVGDLLFRRGVVWVPDFVANAGGLIQVAGELEGRTQQQTEASVYEISNRVADVLTYSASRQVSPATAAAALAERRVIEAKKDASHVREELAHTGATPLAGPTRHATVSVAATRNRARSLEALGPTHNSPK